MTTDSVQQASTEILSHIAAGDFTKALGALLVQADDAPAETRAKSTIASRKKDLAKAVENFDVDVLADVDTKMTEYVDSFVSTPVKLTEGETLTTAQAAELMEEHASYLKLSEFLDTRRDSIKAMVFASITEANRAREIADPEISNGEIRVPELGRVFKREGAGPGKPTLDQTKLRELLGEDASEVFVEKTIPAQVVTELDEEALMKLAMAKPEVMERIRESLIPGKARAGSFQVRDIPKA